MTLMMAPRSRKKKTLSLEGLESRLNLSTLSSLQPRQAIPFSTQVPYRPSSTSAVSSLSNSGIKRIEMGTDTATPQLGGTTISGSTSVPVNSFTAISNCQLESRSSGQNIGWVSTSGSYVDYQISVPASGTYTVSLGVATVGAASLDLKVDGNWATSYSLPNTGWWDTYKTASQNIDLSAGTHTLRLQSTNGTQYNLNAITITPTGNSSQAPSTTNSTTNSTPTSGLTIGTSTSIPLGQYSAISNWALETRNGAQDLGWMSTAGASVDYTINVQSAGTYQLALSTASVSSGSLKVVVNGSTVASVELPNTGWWDTYKTATTTISLAAGQNVLRLQSTSGSQFNLNGIMLTQTGAASNASSNNSSNSTNVTPTTPTTPTTPATGSPVSISSRWMTSYNELVITGTSGNDSILISQSGNTLTIKANGNVQSVSGSFGDMVVQGGDGGDTITIDSSVTLDTLLYGGTGNDQLNNYTRGRATIVSVGGGTDVLRGNGYLTSYWADSGDQVSAASVEQSAGRVHIISSFYGGVSTELQGQNLADPSGTGSTTRLTANSLWGVGPSMDDVQQGQVPDCFVLAPLASLASQSPEKLREMAVDLGDGTYAVQFYRNGVATYVRVDGDLPAGGPYANGLMYAHPGSSGNLWAPIIEKAYAQFRTGANSYASLNYGWVGTMYSDLGIANQTFVMGYDGNALYTSIANALNSGRAVSVGTKSYVSGAPVIAAHAYTIVGATRDAWGNIYFTLRNPWGFDGAGSDGNSSDALVTVSYYQLQQNFSAGAMAV